MPRGVRPSVQMFFELECLECHTKTKTSRKDWQNLKCGKCGRSDRWNLSDFISSTELERLARAEGRGP